MNMDELIKKLRTPKKKTKTVAADMAPKTAAPRSWSDSLPLVVGLCVVGLLLLSLIFFLNAKNRAENISEALTPEQIKGLSADAQFNPAATVRYVEVQEGQDRNVAVSNLGSTIPVINRYNFKGFTKNNFMVVGAAPWALTSNIAANVADPDLLRYLLGNNDLIQAFLARPEVANLTSDPQELYRFTTDKEAMSDFFDSEIVKQVFLDEKALTAVANSRLMSYLLISKSVKYFRDRPDQAAQIIGQNPYLNELKENPIVRRAVLANPYLKTIAPTLLK